MREPYSQSPDPLHTKRNIPITCGTSYVRPCSFAPCHVWLAPRQPTQGNIRCSDDTYEVHIALSPSSLQPLLSTTLHFFLFLLEFPWPRTVNETRRFPSQENAISGRETHQSYYKRIDDSSRGGCPKKRYLASSAIDPRGSSVLPFASAIVPVLK